jgi:hypothetical protein
MTLAGYCNRPTGRAAAESGEATKNGSAVGTFIVHRGQVGAWADFAGQMWAIASGPVFDGECCVPVVRLGGGVG